ncbi:MAG: PTS glucitol/sorbitol transporter subunit IIB [Peptostreptococcaceae bacterium]|nr:PTS glucitol/sorbitol transporter subunit IIB [Peptostreptococcaceae bacterium]
MKKTIKISRGRNGWGGPLIIKPEGKKNKVISVTGGGIDPVAERIADMLGIEVVDGFKTGVPEDEILVAVIDCGGTARSGVYPQKEIFTVNLTAVGKTGPLAKFITEDLYVSDVKLENIKFINTYEGEVSDGSSKREKEKTIHELKAEAKERIAQMDLQPKQQKFSLLVFIGKAVGNVVNKFYQAARDTIEIVMRNVIPFLAFVSLLMGVILKSGVGQFIAKMTTPLATSLPGLVLISVICAIPVLSPLLGPGAVIAQVVGALIGLEIAQGNIPPQYALPALFAIDPQVGADFIPVGLALGEADPKTIEVGVPAILVSRLITGPLAVILAYLASIGLYS